MDEGTIRGFRLTRGSRARLPSWLIEIVRVHISRDSKVVSPLRRARRYCKVSVRTCVHEVGIGALRQRLSGCQGLELGRMPEALDLAQPVRQRVPTRENAAHHPSLTTAIVCVSFKWQATRRMSTVARSAEVDLTSDLFIRTLGRRHFGYPRQLIVPPFAPQRLNRPAAPSELSQRVPGTFIALVDPLIGLGGP